MRVVYNLQLVESDQWLYETSLDQIRIIDMGTEGGNKGGMVIFEVTPHDLLSALHSLTSWYLG